MTMSEGVVYYGSLRRFFENEWYIPASQMGITYWEFWDMNPRIFAVRSAAYEMQLKKDDTRMWQLGQYFYAAVGTVLGNAFRKKGSPPEEYLKKPLMAEYFALQEDPEKNERLAALEMEMWARKLSRDGVQKNEHGNAAENETENEQ